MDFHHNRLTKDQLKLLAATGWTHSLAPSVGVAELGQAHRGVGFISLQNALQETERIIFLGRDFYAAMGTQTRFAELSSDLRDHNKSISLRGVIPSTQLYLWYLILQRTKN